MIVGHGMLARAFASRYAKDTRTLIFASGVADSDERAPSAFEREQRLLDEHLTTHAGRFVYFGSCSAADADRCETPYVRHKLAMEARVLDHAGGLILRLPQVVGRTDNPHTLANFLYRAIRDGEHFTVWRRAERNLVDVDDVVAIAAEFIDGRQSAGAIVTIAAEKSLPVPEIVAIFERLLGRRGHYDLLEKGAPLTIDAGPALAVAAALGRPLTGDYVETVLAKYHGRDA
ncbi:NAD-dependent epimerase/dehydratase family protein [Arenimonas oryziterrae]|uniref:NAD-dependent epimerase/dehydratase domain-containing protein n=1 Tax=Arenimonas oryziterrae DSM 21050 = YC6267 TaxID=1121015 RepID=A0A091ARK6_9GAMM|nr:NAD-dependent epimerase/dehydratase family protein [Arenimonas oryziterrae]KFN42828.1 hypothetical protein N789_11905 [Arenimonas oryziterrae DSM 21050 = YC6267]